MCVDVGLPWGTTHDAGKDGSAIEEWRHNEGNRKGVKTDTSAFMEMEDPQLPTAMEMQLSRNSNKHLT